MTGSYRITVLTVAAMLFIGSLILLMLLYGSHLWVWLTIAGVASFEIGAVDGWFSAGAYLRKARKEKGKGVDPWWSYNLALHAGVHAVVFLTVGIGLFTLAALFKG